MTNQRGGKRSNAGRKPAEEPMESKTIRFKPSEWLKIKNLADAENVSVGEYVRNLIKKEIENNP